ncbi:hemin uptake protein HemP [Xanthobacteraceae bacterium A53D]
MLDSAALFAAGRTVRILHDDQVYVLRLTSSGKIILTK